MKNFERLKTLIKNKEATIGIVGLGYIGLALADEAARIGFNVIGIEKLNYRRKDAKIILNNKIEISKNFADLKSADIIIITVQTPLTKAQEPDLSYVIKATKEIARILEISKNKLIILESTTYPGTTEEVLFPALSKATAQVGNDFYLAYSPERIDPGNKKYRLKQIPKLVSGVTAECLELATLFYRQLVDTVIPVSSTRVAEMAKVLENVFRSVNVALVNELALLCDRMNIDIWEVIEAASTKPFGHMKFLPGPGLGGHCIPIDPFYLSWKAREYEFHTEFIELAGKINQSMPYYVVEKVVKALNNNGQSIKEATVLVIGVAYKKDISDVRESPAIRIIELLKERGAAILFHDPYVDKIAISSQEHVNCALTAQVLRSANLALIVTDHSQVDYSLLVRNSSLIVDTRNVLKDFKFNKIVRI